MSCNKDFEKIQSVPVRSMDYNQQQNKADVVSMKDCISSGLTSAVMSSRNVAADFTGMHESEALAYHSSVSTSVGVQSETVNGSVIPKNDPKSSGLVKPNSLNSRNKNGCLTSTSSKAVVDMQRDIKLLGKAPHLNSNFTATTPSRTYHQMGKFSSLANPRHHVYPPTFCRPNGRVSGVNDRFLSSDKFRSGESELSVEMTRGPRGHYNKFHPEPPAANDVFAITICRDRYNLPDFPTEYEIAKFYVIKSFNEDDVHKSIKYDVWTSTPNGNKKLNAAFLDAEAKLKQTGKTCPVFLFFSVNASRQFVGVAEMLGPVDFKKDMTFWKLDKYNGFFPTKWHIIKDVPNNQFRHIILESNENKPVTFTRDTQEIGLKEGLEMLNIFKSYSAKTSLLDDFDFYENREKLFRSQKSTKHASPGLEVYGNDNYHNVVKARDRKAEMQSSSTNQVNLVKLTQNLSLNPSGKQGFR